MFLHSQCFSFRNYHELVSRFSETPQLSFSEAMDLLEENVTDEPSVDSNDNGLHEDHSQTTSSLTVAYDMGWQKRSSGRKYDSLSGVGAVVGNKTKKILAFGVKQKDCRKCTYFMIKKLPIPDHRC